MKDAEDEIWIEKNDLDSMLKDTQSVLAKDWKPETYYGRVIKVMGKEEK